MEIEFKDDNIATGRTSFSHVDSKPVDTKIIVYQADDDIKNLLKYKKEIELIAKEIPLLIPKIDSAIHYISHLDFTTETYADLLKDGVLTALNNINDNLRTLCSLEERMDDIDTVSEISKQVKTISKVASKIVKLSDYTTQINSLYINMEYIKNITPHLDELKILNSDLNVLLDIRAFAPQMLLLSKYYREYLELKTELRISDKEYIETLNFVKNNFEDIKLIRDNLDTLLELSKYLQKHNVNLSQLRSYLEKTESIQQTFQANLQNKMDKFERKITGIIDNFLLLLQKKKS